MQCGSNGDKSLAFSAIKIKMPEYLKAKVYKIVLHPVEIYRAECHPMMRKHKSILWR